MAHARRRLYVVGELDEGLHSTLTGLAVEIVPVKAFDERCPHANKLKMFVDEDDVDYLVALDTDVVITGDFSHEVRGSAVAAKQVDQDPFGIPNWMTLFEYFSVPFPSARFLTHFAFAETIPYFNSGVLIVPMTAMSRLAAPWGRFVTRLLEAYDELPQEIVKHRFFTDQIALALALADSQIPFRALPLEMNFPTHRPLSPDVQTDRVAPLILHHHHRLDDEGLMLPTGYCEPDTAIARANAVMHRPGATEGPRSSFDNAQFWNERYRANPQLGSGIGSRGEIAEYKRAVLQTEIDRHAPASILDVGCGDMEIVRHLRHDAFYLGTDVSRVIVDRNAQLFPHHAFMVGSFSSAVGAVNLRADLVLCLDVLIHQHQPEEYQGLVAALIAATKRIGLISGYESPPAAQYQSDITAYHEPLSQTLRAHGALDIVEVGRYRDTALLRYAVAPSPPGPAIPEVLRRVGKAVLPRAVRQRLRRLLASRGAIDAKR